MSNEGNIKASILLILLKCIVVGYSNGNESFTGRLFSNYGPLNMLFHFFRYLVYSVFHKTFVKTFMKKLSFSSSNFKNLFPYVVYYRKLGCLTLWYWNGGPLKIRCWKFGKFVSFWGCFFRNRKMLTFWILWIKYFGNAFSFLIKWYTWVYYCWNYGPSNLKAELKADFWLQIGIYSRKNYPRYGSGQLPPANS